MIKTFLFALLFLSAIGFFTYSILNFLKYLKIGKRENRLNNIGQRIINTLQIAIFQSKLFRQKFAGFLHIIIFWGFLALLIVVIEGFIEGFVHGFSFSFIGKFYSVITFTQDFFGLLVLVTVIFSLFRRYIGTPKRLQVERAAKLDATVILIMISLVMITMLGANAERILLGNSAGLRPVSQFIADNIITTPSNTLYEFFFWAHNIIVLGFLNYLPYSKHFHVLSSVINTFFSNYKIDRKNVIKPIMIEDKTDELNPKERLIDFMNDEVPQLGARDIEDLTWKNILDGYTCTECGRCTEVCPANSTGKLLNPKNIVKQVRKRTMDKGPLVVKKVESDPILEKALVHDYISQEELWACTTCAACVEECPVMIDHLSTIIELRRNLNMMESAFPNEVATVQRNLENNESPWAFPADMRNDWIEEFISENGSETNLKKLSNEGSADNLDVVFWVGCAGAFDNRYKNVTKSFAGILNKAGIKFGVLGSEERCTGDTARRLGNEFAAVEQFIKPNIETFKHYKIKKIVTMCPHCFHSLKNEYTQFGAEFEVKHHTEYIGELISSGKISTHKGNKSKFTYHDSCYLGRYNEVYDAPRKAINNISENGITEMKRSKSKGFCCGAGGGRMFMEETEGKRVNIERTEEALSTGADVIASACPFCMTMLTDGVKAKEKTEEVKVKDIAEIIWENIKE